MLVDVPRPGQFVGSANSKGNRNDLCAQGRWRCACVLRCGRRRGGGRGPPVIPGAALALLAAMLAFFTPGVAHAQSCGPDFTYHVSVPASAPARSPGALCDAPAPIFRASMWRDSVDPAGSGSDDGR